MSPAKLASRTGVNSRVRVGAEFATRIRPHQLAATLGLTSVLIALLHRSSGGLIPLPAIGC
jgi:hypothetical protein